MYEIGIHRLINRLDASFHFLGMWQNEETPLVRKIGSYLVYLTFSVGFIVALMFGAILTNSKDESFFLGATALCDVIVVIRSNKIKYKRKKILTFLRENCLHSLANESDVVEVKKKLQNFINFATLFMIVVLVPTSTLFIMPAFSKDRTLPLSIGFPLNWRDNNYVYLLAYVYCIISLLYISVTTYMNVLIWYLMIGYSIQYDNLGYRLRDLGISKLTAKSKVPEAEALFHRDLLEVIRLHKTLLNNVNEFKSLFSDIFFVQIMISGICICGSIYALTIASYESQSQLVVYLCVVLYGIFDIFMLMYLANDIRLSSNRLSYYIFESNWIQQPKSTKKYLIILTENVKQPHELMIYKLYPLNMQTFTSILRAAYSMFNILRNI